MDLFLSFVLQSVGYFITSYFLFSILGRKRKIGYIFLAIVFLSNLYPYIEIGFNLDAQILVLGLVYDVGPVFFAFLIFSSITGGIPMIKVKRNRKLKSVSTKIQPKTYRLRNAYLVVGLSVIAGSTSYFIFESITRYVIIGFSVMGLLFGLFLLFDSLKIMTERVIVFVGREKEKIFMYEIPKEAKTIEISDFFNNDNYIVDPIGEVTLVNESKKQHKDYLYWIATSDKFSVEPPLYPVQQLAYQDDLYQFEKYHLKHVWYKELKTGKIEKMKEKLIK